MISYKILTILNVIIVLSYCSVNNDLTEEQKIFHKKCVASLIKVGFKYGSGFVNFCYAMQFIYENFREEKTQKMYFGQYAENIIITKKNEDEMFEQMTDKERYDILQVVLMYHSEIMRFPYNLSVEIKTPKEFCTGILKGSCCLIRLITNLRLKAKLKIEECTSEILKKYDKENEFRNVVITYEKAFNLEPTMSNNKIDKLIKTWPIGERQYFKYHIKMINDHDSKLSTFSIRTWCNDFLKKKKYNLIESLEDIKLTHESNKTIETNPIQGKKRFRFIIESIENK